MIGICSNPLKSWWAVRDSNSRHPRCKRGALPTELTALAGSLKSTGRGIDGAAGLVKSTSEALRMIRQGAVRIDGARVEDEKLAIDSGAAHVVQVVRFYPKRRKKGSQTRSVVG